MSKFRFNLETESPPKVRYIKTHKRTNTNTGILPAKTMDMRNTWKLNKKGAIKVTDLKLNGKQEIMKSVRNTNTLTSASNSARRYGTTTLQTQTQSRNSHVKTLS